MAISVADKVIPHHGALSERAQLALVFIDGGHQWLAWAASAAASYGFGDETALVTGVQQGIHASPFTLLPGLGLLVSPAKLMSLKPTELRALLKAEGGDRSPAIQVQTRKILADHALATHADLAVGTRFLADAGVADRPVFQAMGLEDRLAILELLQRSEGRAAHDKELQKDAAEFGVQQARTPREFVDFYQSYLYHVVKLEARGQSREDRAALVDAAVQTLQPLLFGALDCPQLDGLSSPAEVRRAVSAWLTVGKQVGFARISEGVQQIIQYTTFERETGDAAKAIVGKYLAGAQALLGAAAPTTGRLGQDGATCVFPLESGELAAELELGPTGVVSLRAYRRKPAPAPAARGPEGAGDAPEASGS
jgi:hypothetical protein